MFFFFGQASLREECDFCALKSKKWGRNRPGLGFRYRVLELWRMER